MLGSPANLAREQNARKRRNLCEIIGSRKGEQNKHHCFCIIKSKRRLMLNKFRWGGNQKQNVFLTFRPLY